MKEEKGLEEGGGKRKRLKAGIKGVDHGQNTWEYLYEKNSVQWICINKMQKKIAPRIYKGFSELNNKSKS